MITLTLHFNEHVFSVEEVTQRVSGSKAFFMADKVTVNETVLKDRNPSGEPYAWRDDA